MNFAIHCQTYARLAPIALNAEDENCRCIRIECKGGKMVAFVTNRRIAAVEYLGDNSETGFVDLIVNEALIAQCETETPFESVLNIVTIDALKMASAKTTLGYNYPGVAAIFPDKSPLTDWRNIPEKAATKTRGAMFWSGDQIAKLTASSPSRSIAFPEFIDASKPVIIRDVIDSDWFGMFLPNRKLPDGSIVEVTPAALPDWFAK